MHGIEIKRLTGRARLVGRARWDLGRLEELEQSGGSATAPSMAIGGVAFVLMPASLFMLGLALAAYFLART